MLSTVAKLFDPLGLLGPITLLAKIIMQKLWQLKLDCEESVSSSIHTFWTDFHSKMNLIDELRFDRKVLLEGATNTEIHALCDTRYGIVNVTVLASISK